MFWMPSGVDNQNFNFSDPMAFHVATIFFFFFFPQISAKPSFKSASAVLSVYDDATAKSKKVLQSAPLHSKQLEALKQFHFL